MFHCMFRDLSTEQPVSEGQYHGHGHVHRYLTVWHIFVGPWAILTSAILTALMNFQPEITSSGPSGYNDSSWFLQKNPDMATSGSLH